MKRRAFITLVGGAAVVWPLAARAQQPGMPVVGLLTSRAADDVPQLLAAFRQGLKEMGVIEGQNVAIEYRFAGNRNDRLPALAADLVHRRVTVIAALTTAAALAAKAATTSIPIVFEGAVNPTNPAVADQESTSALSAAHSVGLKLHVLNASTERDFDGVFAQLVQLGAGGLVIGSDGFFTARSEQLGALALRHAVPAVYENREFTAAGGLISYGGSLA